MKLGELLPSLSGVRRGGQGYVAKCPAHDDNKASLSLAEDSGRILMRCFAGCQTATIVSRLGITFRDLFDQRIKEPSRETLGPNKKTLMGNPNPSWYAESKPTRVHCIYPYVDEEGRLMYENVRFYPKEFRQRRYDVGGQMIWSLEGVKRLPYRLPNLIEAAKKGQDIFLCEGEKDADTLYELGFAASSFKNWCEDFNRYIEGSHVIIVQDHDRPGVTQANEAAKIVLRSAASVKVLDMWDVPGSQELPDKQGRDISDYITQCVEIEGMDRDAIKERICLAIENVENWKDTTRTKAADYFVVQSGNEWISQAKQERIPEMLFGELWFENELCILFADTNVGKSILAVQIADQVSRGGTGQNHLALAGGFLHTPNAGTTADAVRVAPSEPGHVETQRGGKNPPAHAGGTDTLRTTVPAQKVIYFDFELTAKQFESRFSEREEGSETFVNHYQFHRNFYRAEINPETSDIGDHVRFEDFLNASLEQTIVSTGAKVIIIDNLTYLRDETENARNALPLMKYLKGLKSKYGLSILALAHTPKRDSTKPLGRNDLQGSKMLINFCDSSFAIGESAKQPGLRYLKQIKARNTEIVYHTENVLMASVAKRDNFLQFEFGETAAEIDHLKVHTSKERDELKEQAKQLAATGMSARKIASQLGISAMTASRYLKV